MPRWHGHLLLSGVGTLSYHPLFDVVSYPCLPDVLRAISMKQEQISITQPVDLHSTVSISCKVTGGLASTYVHWYRALPGQALQRLLYLTLEGSNVKRDTGFSREKFTAIVRQSTCTLLVRKVEKTDSGHYYCATWEYTQSHEPLLDWHKNPPQL